jgi:hypothetical protein
MVAAPLGSSRAPRFDIADIVRAHREELEHKLALGPAERRVLSAIALCRTAALGGFLDRCCACGHEHPAYNSCRNRHCPKCQALAQEEWIAERAEQLLPVRHFHVVFTLPSQLRPLCRFAPREMFDALLQAAARTVLELAASRWAAVPGITAVLHTWTRELLFHPHVHLLVTAGGLSLDGETWVSRKRYLFPIAMMQVVFRAKMLEALRRMGKQGIFDGLDAFEDPEAFDRLLAQIARLDWVVYTKKPFHRAENVLRYLGRYTHRVALSNSRLLEVSPTAVTFRTRGEEKVTLHPVEFLRRFLLHLLPDGFHKIRHYGLYASANAQTRLNAARGLLLPAGTAEGAPAREGDGEQATWADQLLALTGRDVRRCRRCGGPVERIPLPRAPPAVA